MRYWSKSMTNIHELQREFELELTDIDEFADYLGVDYDSLYESFYILNNPYGLNYDDVIEDELLDNF
jgi:hypothetical protein